MTKVARHLTKAPNAAIYFRCSSDGTWNSSSNWSTTTATRTFDAAGLVWPRRSTLCLGLAGGASEFCPPGLPFGACGPRDCKASRRRSAASSGVSRNSAASSCQPFSLAASGNSGSANPWRSDAARASTGSPVRPPEGRVKTIRQGRSPSNVPSESGRARYRPERAMFSRKRQVPVPVQTASLQLFVAAKPPARFR